MNPKYLLGLIKRNTLFWLSRKIDYPLLPPDAVQVNFTFRCNLRCKMCSMEAQERLLKSLGRQVEIDSETFRKVIRQAKEIGSRSILFIGGEPFLREDIFELIDYAHRLGLSSIVVTNGALLKEDAIKKCFASGLEWLSISIDAARDETFSKIRGEGVLGAIIENIGLLNRLKKEAKKEFPKLVTCSTIMNDNLEELIKIIELCKKLKIERVLFQPVVANNIDQTERLAGNPGFVPRERLGVLDRAMDGLIEYKKQSASNFDFIGNSIRNLSLIKKYFRGEITPKDQPCYAGYNRLQIVQEGKLYFCVNQQQHQANLGDIKKDSLASLWFSEEARSFRRLIKKCDNPCLQWCSYRDEFMELAGAWQKSRYFKGKRA